MMMKSFKKILKFSDNTEIVSKERSSFTVHWFAENVWMVSRLANISRVCTVVHYAVLEAIS